MTTAAQHAPATDAHHVDVLIAGAGISGVGSAYHLQQQCPGKSYLILEMQDSFGGTWKTHKYPGVRSDSDLYTFGYRFKPWVGAPIASAEPTPVRAAPGYWRPQAGAPTTAWRSKKAFRPRAYGRSVADKVDVASGREGSGFTRDHLPGWVTTYQDTTYEGTCSWCSGS